MVRADVLETLRASGSRRRASTPSAFLPSYGMAESTLAVTFATLDEAGQVDVIDRAQCKLWRRAVPAERPRRSAETAAASSCAAGRCPATSSRSADDEGRPLADREIGRIFVKGPSLMAGYFGNDEATRAVMRRRRLHGHRRHGLHGRRRDRHHRPGQGPDHHQRPQHLAAGHRMGGRSRSRACAAAMPQPCGRNAREGEDRLVILLQCRLTGPPDMEALRRAVAAAVHRSAGVECEVVLIRRAACPSPRPENCRGQPPRRAILPAKSRKSACPPRQTMTDPAGGRRELTAAPLARNGWPIHAACRVTGVSGFIGRHVAKALLDRGVKVRGLDAKPRRGLRKPCRDAIEVVEGDIASGSAAAELTRGAEAVVHCAGAVRACSRQEFSRRTSLGTQRIAEAAEREGVARFVHVSSIAAREPSSPTMRRARAKGEGRLARAARRMSGSIVRPPAVYGPGDRATLPLVARLEPPRRMAAGNAPMPGSR